MTTMINIKPILVSFQQQQMYNIVRKPYCIVKIAQQVQNLRVRIKRQQLYNNDAFQQQQQLRQLPTDFNASINGSLNKLRIQIWNQDLIQDDFIAWNEFEIIYGEKQYPLFQPNGNIRIGKIILQIRGGNVQQGKQQLQSRQFIGQNNLIKSNNPYIINSNINTNPKTLTNFQNQPQYSQVNYNNINNLNLKNSQQNINYPNMTTYQDPLLKQLPKMFINQQQQQQIQPPPTTGFGLNYSGSCWNQKTNTNPINYNQNPYGYNNPINNPNTSSYSNNSYMNNPINYNTGNNLNLENNGWGNNFCNNTNTFKNDGWQQKNNNISQSQMQGFMNVNNFANNIMEQQGLLLPGSQGFRNGRSNTNMYNNNNNNWNNSNGW